MRKALTIEQAYRMFFREYPDVLTVKQLGTILGICEKSALKLVTEKQIQSIQVGRLYRIPKLFLMEYLGIIDSSKTNESREKR